MSRRRGDEKYGWRTPHDIPAPDISEVQRLLAPWLVGRRVIAVEALSGGLMNRNCRIAIESEPAPVVLRIYDRDPDACAKELAIFNLAGERVPVPTVLYADLEPAHDIPPFALLEFIPGISLRELARSGSVVATADAAYEAGLLLARLQEFRFPETGLLTPALTVDTSRFDGQLTTAGLVERFAKSPTFQRRVAAPLLDRLLDLARNTDEPQDQTATLVHGDFNAANIRVHEARGRWSVAAILDWEFAFAASPLCDVGNFLRYERATSPRYEPAFSNGCRDGGLALNDDWRQAARMADLPALCEMLTRDSVPHDVAMELLDLASRTADSRI